MFFLPLSTPFSLRQAGLQVLCCPQVFEHDAIVTGQMALGLRQGSKHSPKIVPKSGLVENKHITVCNLRPSSGSNLKSNPGPRQRLANKGIQDNSKGLLGKQARSQKPKAITSTVTQSDMV